MSEPYAILAIRFLVAFLFVAAAWAKIRDPESLRYRLIEAGASARSAGLLLVLVPLTEIVTGVALISTNWLAVVVWTQLLLAVFTIYLFHLVRKGLVESCSCFGAGLDVPPGQAIIRNFVLIAVLAIPYSLLSLPLNPAHAEIFVPSVLTGLAATMVLTAFHMLGRRQARILSENEG